MANPMLAQLSESGGAGNLLVSHSAENLHRLANMAQQLRNVLKLLRGGGDISTILQTAAVNNPSIQQALQVAQKYGGDYNKAFQETARNAGINPDEVSDCLKQLGIC